MSPTSHQPKWSFTPSKDLYISSTAISNDGHYLLFGTSNNSNANKDAAIYCYYTDGSQYRAQWQDQLKQNSLRSIHSVALSGDGEYAVAGGEYNEGNGFIRSYTVSHGISSRQEFSTTSRIHEVVINDNGKFVVAVEDKAIHFLTRKNTTFIDNKLVFDDTCLNSCAISEDGAWIIVGGGNVDKGTLIVYSNQQGKLKRQSQFKFQSMILRVAVTLDGEYAAASTSTGEVICLHLKNINSIVELWRYSADDFNIGDSRALSICHTADAEVYVGVGGNNTSPQPQDTPNFGYAYMLKNIKSRFGKYYAERIWINKLNYCPNAGMTIDASGKMVTSTDGQTLSGTANSNQKHSETPGNFYLFDVKSGDLLWKYHTRQMNYSMTINADCSAIVAGSVDGSIYYWGSPI